MVSSWPKILHPLGGKPLIGHVIEAARLLNPAEIFVVYGYQKEATLAALKQDYPEVIAIEQVEQLGTGHAVLQVLPHLAHDRQVLIVCGDVPLIRADTLRTLCQSASPEGLGLLTAEVEHPFGLGRILRGQSGEVLSIIEEKDANETEKKITEINAGAYASYAKDLQRWLPQLSNQNAQKEFYLTDIVTFARQDQLPITGVHPQVLHETYGVNTRAELVRLERIYQDEKVQRLLSQGVSVADPKRIDIRGDVTPAKDVFLDINVVLKGKIVLGEGCEIGAGAILENVTLGKGVKIQPYSVLSGVEVAADCTIGPFARLRPGTKLAVGVHIGNFVEVKNTSLGAGTKAGHLSYLGDAQIGQKVNIGAGVITCNYDGAHKHVTHIEDDVFVGSDVQLIAPVRIEKGATIGAGTTVSKDAPANKLTVGRAPQKVIEGWVRPRKP